MFGTRSMYISMPIKRDQSHKDSNIEHINCKRYAVAKYRLTVGAPCLALTNEGWDLYCESMEINRLVLSGFGCIISSRWNFICS